MKSRIEVFELSLDELSDILSNFNSVGSYWCSLLDVCESDYKEAKQQLRKEFTKNLEFCVEDIWAKVLLNGKSIELTENEDELKFLLYYERILYAISYLINNGKISSNIEDWDCDDCDMIIQQSIFGEVIYG